MNRASRYSRATLDLFFIAVLIVLLILLRYISRKPQELPITLSDEADLNTPLEQDRPVTEEATNPAPAAISTIESDEAATKENIAFDSSNKAASNIVDTLAESSSDEIAVSPASDLEVPADIAQEELAEQEVEPQQELEGSVEKTEAYCVKCREKRDMQNAQRIVTRNGRNALEGTCPVCGTRLFRFIAR